MFTVILDDFNAWQTDNKIASEGNQLESFACFYGYQ